MGEIISRRLGVGDNLKDLKKKDFYGFQSVGRWQELGKNLILRTSTEFQVSSLVSHFY